MDNKNEVLIYEDKDGLTRVDVKSHNPLYFLGIFLFLDKS